MTKEKEVKNTEADKIWEEIKDLPIEMFSLPNQKISDYVTKINLPGKQLTVILKTTSVITSLEYAIGRIFDIDQGEKYITISRKEKEIDPEIELAEVVVANTVLKNKTSK